MSVNIQEALQDDLRAVERRFRRACMQVFVLNKEVEKLKNRYIEAEVTGNKTLRYHLRLRISVIEGVRNMFYEYAAQKADVITELQEYGSTSDDSFEIC